jgi:hypothetical protein
MPYEISEEDGKFCVKKKDGGKTFGCHATREKAEAQMRAIQASEHDAKESILHAQEMFSRAQEAVFNDENLTAEVTLVRAGVSQNGRNWKPAALKRAAESGFWNDTRMFLEHQDPKKPPFRRTLASGNGPFPELLSAVESARYVDDEGGRVVGLVNFFDENFYKYAKRAQKHLGVSLDVRFRGLKVRQPDGRVQEEVEELVQNNSVDWVAFPAAGGAIDRFLPAQESEENVKWEDITPEMIQEHAPDLFARIQESAQEPAAVPGKQTPPPSGNGNASQSPADLKSFVDERIQEARDAWEEEARNKVSVRRQIEEKVGAAALPEKAKKQIIAGFDGASEYDENRVQESIDSMKTLLEEVGAPKVRGMGPSDGSGGNLSDEEKKVTIAKAAPTYSAVESALMGSYAPNTERAQEEKK